MVEPAPSEPPWFPRDRVRVAAEITSVARPTRAIVERHIRERRPLILRGAVPSELASTWTAARLAAAVGDQACSLYVSRSGQFPSLMGAVDRERFRRVTIPFRECIARLDDPTALPPLLWPGERLYLYQEPMAAAMAPLLDEIPAPAVLPEVRGAQQRNIWISQRGNITPPHVDIKENLLVQIVGRKHLLLWDAGQYRRLSLAPFGAAHAAHSRIDITDPDLERFPAFAGARAVEGWLEPGDALYIPFDNIHTVHSATFCVSVNYWWGIDDLATRLKRLVRSPIRRYVARSALAALRAGLADRRGVRPPSVQR